MCDPGQHPGPAAALAAVTAGLAALAGQDMTALTTGEQADVLRALGRIEGQAVAVRSAALAAFDTTCGFEADGAAGSRSWLRWQTRVTAAAAARRGRLDAAAAHPSGRRRGPGRRRVVAVVGAAHL